MTTLAAPINPLERRITLRLMAYWEKIRQGRDMPSENDIDPDDIGDLWDNCFLIQIRDLEKSDYNYTYLGTAIIEAYRGNLTEDYPAELIALNANKLDGHFREVIINKHPVIHEGEFTNLSGSLVKYRQCLLPLSHDLTNVDAIFGGMRFKIF